MSDRYNILDGGVSNFFIRKFGRNDDVDTGPEDIWDGGGLYPWPTSAQATTIASANAADTAAGTGMRTARVFGLDTDYLEVQEDVTLNGLTPVALSNQYLRVYRAYGLTWGSGETNAGNIDIQHGATVIARISAGRGQTLMAIYTIPANWPTVSLVSASATIGKQAASFGEIIVFTRDFNSGGWRDRLTVDINSQGSSFIGGITQIGSFSLEPKTDIRMTAQSVSAANTGVSGLFTISDQ